MSARDLIVYALLALGVGLQVVAAVGIVATRDVYDRLHFLGPSTLGVIPIVAAIWVREGASMIGLKAAVLAAVVLFSSPALAHATGRAMRLSERGDWRPQPDERLELEGR